MRQNQITIKICRFGSEVPRTYPEQRQEIEVYSDSNNFYQALSIAYAKAIEEILDDETREEFVRYKKIKEKLN